MEFTVTATDEAPVQPIAERIRFRLYFALFMLTEGRTDEAADAFEHLFELIDQIED